MGMEQEATILAETPKHGNWQTSGKARQTSWWWAVALKSCHGSKMGDTDCLPTTNRNSTLPGCCDVEVVSRWWQVKATKAKQAILQMADDYQ